MGSDQLMDLLNLLTCLVGAGLSICRLVKMNSRVKMPLRVLATIQLVLFIASGISYTYDQPASFIQWLMGLGLISYLLLGVAPWKHGPPSCALKA